MPVYSLDDPTVMDPPLSNYSQEKMDSSKLPASNNLAVEPTESLSSSYVEPQAIPIPLVPACLNMDCTTNGTMVVALTLAAHDTPVTTRGPHQDTVDEIFDPCIKLLGGEMLPSQLHSLAADQESKSSLQWILLLKTLQCLIFLLWPKLKIL